MALTWKKKTNKWSGLGFHETHYQLHTVYLDKLSNGNYRLAAFSSAKSWKPADENQAYDKVRFEFPAKSTQYAKKVVAYLMEMYYASKK